MTRLLFWDVDTLYDFMRADGRLYVPDSEAIIPTLAALTAFAHTRGLRSWPRRRPPGIRRGDLQRARLDHHVSASLHARHISRPPCDPPHSGDFGAAYLASLVGVRPNSCLRDVRDKP